MPSIKVIKNFHVPLPGEIYASLHSEAERLGRPATALAREAIESFLKQRRRATLHHAIASYATSHAGTDADLDSQLEATAVQHLLEEV